MWDATAVPVQRWLTGIHGSGPAADRQQSPRSLIALLKYDNVGTVIRSFGNRLAEDLYDDRRSAAVRRLPPALYAAARRKLLYLHDADALRDLRVPPGNRLEALKGGLRGWFSIRVNEQLRIVFRWSASSAFDVKIVDYH